MIVRLARIVIAVMTALAIATGMAMAQKRVALVIGNGAYDKVEPLANTLNDSADVAAALERLGFEVTTVRDAGYDAMRRGLRDFSRKGVGAEVSIVFYAGHGIEMGGENYLIPVDAELARDTDIEHEAIPLKSVTATVDGAKLLGLVILDACRNNPFAAKMAKSGAATRSIGRGLARVEPTGSVLVAFAAKEGTTAADGAGRNSPFTASLLKHIETPDLEISFLFRNVRDDVVETTSRSQEPFVYGSLSRNAIFLKTAPKVVASSPTAPAPAPVPAKPAAPLFSGDPGIACDLAAAYPNDSRRPSTIRAVPNGKVDGQLTIAACSAALAKYPDQPRYEFQLARGYFSIGNFDQGLEFASRAARRDYAIAACTIGEMHTNQRLARNVNEFAVRWYEIGVEKGEYECANNLAHHYMSGAGVETNPTRAAALFKIAADKGMADAQVSLGFLLWNGRGVAKDTASARRLFEAATNAGNTNAMAHLSKLLREIAPQLAARSASLLLAAFKGGDATARLALTERSSETLDAAWRLAIEQELAALGHLRRAPTGNFDAETQAGLERFLLAR